MKKTSVITRILTAVAALSMIAAIYLPIWKIDLTAPQYPEGLYMTIHADKVGGDIEIINGLNHYIGMKTIHADEFVEFTVLPYIIWLLVVLGLITAVVNKRKLFYSYFAFFILFALVAMVDFYRWEYNYGHDLDPTAPIQVPGQGYQPPLIGYKQLLNFSAYSIPDKGGWAFIGSGVLLSIGAVIEYMRQRKEKKNNNKSFPLGTPVTIAAMAVMLLGCTTGPQAIRFGKDGCDHCKMTIMDQKFGGEIITDKGKVFRFDDTRCMVDFINAGKADKTTSAIYFLDYSGTGNLIKSDSALLMQSDQLRSPMGGNTAAFRDAASRQSIMTKLQGTEVKWEDLLK